MKSGSQRPNLREERFSCVISRVLPALEDSLRNAERLPRAWGPSVIVKVEHLKTAFCPPLPSSCNTTLHNEELITKQDPSGKKVIDCHHESSHDPHGPHQWHKVRQKAEAFCARPDKDPSSIQRGPSQSCNQPLRQIQCHYPHPSALYVVNKTWPQILIRWHQKLIRWHQFKPGTKN